MAGISISIKAGTTAADSWVNASGSQQHIISDEERNSYGIGDAALTTAVAKYFGKAPNDAYLHSPTPWNDLYKTYNWPQVQTTLVVQSAKITGITSEPVIVATKTLANNSKVPATFNAGISDSVTNPASSTWSNSNSVTVGQKVTYDVSFLGSGGGGETSFSYSHTWGESKTETTSVTVGSQQGVSVPLDPGQSVDVQLTASRGVMKVRITYLASLSGSCAVNYNPTFKDHHFFSLGVGGIMQTSGLATTKQIVEDIEIGYFSNAKVELLSSDGALMQSLDASDEAGPS
jgi:hypothetical protein